MEKDLHNVAVIQSEDEISAAVPRVLIMDEENRIKEVRNLKRG